MKWRSYARNGLQARRTCNHSFLDDASLDVARLSRHLFFSATYNTIVVNLLGAKMQHAQDLPRYSESSSPPMSLSDSQEVYIIIYLY